MSGENTAAETLLQVEHLRKWFLAKGAGSLFRTSYIKAVNDVSFTLNKYETLGVVGESGCGKSTMGRVILRLLAPSGGKVLFEGKDLGTLSGSKFRKLRADMQIIFQDPYASLDPRFTVGDAIAEPLNIQRHLDMKTKLRMVADMMERVGLNPRHIGRYPHEFSGGQRQRIGIARAMILKPKLVVCDEPVSALDVSIQGQVINLLKDLQKELGMAYIFISHDLSVIRHISDRVLVMYLGNVVELAPKEALYARKLHPYTQALLSAIPIPGRRVKREKIILQGDLPSPANPPPGCCFHTRCFMARDICKIQTPQLEEYMPAHYCACHFAEKNKEATL
ncbi:oligopeptide transport ATP-binding protein AppF [Treponema primitia ZAS-2]|uniref:Oligopeptide transport ATP-binding protein AppF n=1 Tax=Treponema primitia (strain ATCC BAA-887 / DSM 12427 / ZAS-2) TaxID=545694 RepID=F5YQR8_TREPZ|nr:dipeptide ABC transporter ATP-binding protein [Treponema primitia]AEF85151.1 oligopeptide transport ATP-binding protein AppF [Treponema primitia ZAS-2]